ncbi:cytochrome c oxidase assembly protein COX16 homolog, mitochondrial [Contarinia nasturtii]|uniref:cytochrome c oxidase assembly protein COX16 homolog, mitochondrial n=1 Tax=Contarinia nasturtii TaxID=265458 RepID=UPI0012D480B9|nr:cytochrome c oxidase assembly protein COX16 homolog, mitochondrial [Contarinia nasturtii]
MRDLFERLKVQLKRNRMFNYGLPLLTLVVLGPFVLQHFGEVRYKYRKVKQVPKEELEAMGLKSTEDITLESEYEKIKQMDIDTWEQKRGPRPWEENFDEDPAK